MYYVEVSSKCKNILVLNISIRYMDCSFFVFSFFQKKMKNGPAAKVKIRAIFILVATIDKIIV